MRKGLLTYKENGDNFLEEIVRGDRSQLSRDGRRRKLPNGYWVELKKIYRDIGNLEIVSCFLFDRFKTSSISINDILEIFRLTPNSEIPFFEDYDKRILTKLQNGLHSWSYNTTITRTIDEYRNYPEEWKILNISDNHVSLKNDVTSHERRENYRSILNEECDYKTWVQFLTDDLRQDFLNGEVYYYDKEKKTEKNICIKDYIYDNIVSTDNYRGFLNLSPRKQEGITIALSEMNSWAKEMDELNYQKWENRTKDLVFSVPRSNKLVDSQVLNIDGLLNCVGALSVGKSTFIKVATYGLVNKGKKISIILNTSADVMSLVDDFKKLNIKAVPLLSWRQISEHQQKYFASFEHPSELFQNREALNYCNDHCMLFNCNIDESDDYKEPLSRPCFTLYVKRNEKAKPICCPFIEQCPSFNNIRELNDAKVVVTTINSAVQSYLPPYYSNVKINILEYIIKTTDLTFIDESDQVLASLDSLFINAVDLYGSRTIFSRKVEEKELEFRTQGKVYANNELERFVNDVSGANILIRNIVEMASNNQAVNDLFPLGIRDKVINSEILWDELFVKQIGFENLLNERKNDQETKNLFNSAIRAFGNKLDLFRRGLIHGEVPSPDNSLYMFRSIASNYIDESKLDSDMERITNLKLSELLEWDEDKAISREKFKDLIWLYENWDKPIIDCIDKAEEKIDFILKLYMLEYLLKKVIERSTLVNALDSELIDAIFPGALLKEEYAGIVPSLPVNLSYGFQIKYDDDTQSVKMSYTNVEGVGRWILLNFDKLYKYLDGSTTNCVLLSGTSNMIWSTKYYIDHPVDCLLRKQNSKKSKIKMFFPSSIATKVSGRKSSESLPELKNNLLAKGNVPGGISYLDSIYNTLPEKRKRILFVLGSYEDCKNFSERLDNVHYLVRKKQESDNNYEIERSKIERIPQFKVEGIAIPLLSGRGYNIVVDIIEKELTEPQTVAALGAACFIKRPYYIPHDISTAIQWYNSAYVKSIQRYQAGDFLSFNDFWSYVGKRIRASANDFRHMRWYESLTDESRNKLLGDTLVDVYQMACRLIRGGVDATIYFLDTSFAPGNANGQGDSEKSSMLIGWRKRLHEMINTGDEAYQEINSELYQILYDGLCELSLMERCLDIHG